MSAGKAVMHALELRLFKRVTNTLRLGKSKLREIFLKTDNYLEGRYFAELIKVWLLFICHLSCVLFMVSVTQWQYDRYFSSSPAGIYLFKVNNENSRKCD